jgi:hypothetical protein
LLANRNRRSKELARGRRHSSFERANEIEPMNVCLSRSSNFQQFSQTIKSCDADRDLSWWSDTYGAGMKMNWPTFEVSNGFDLCFSHDHVLLNVNGTSSLASSLSVLSLLAFDNHPCHSLGTDKSSSLSPSSSSSARTSESFLVLRRRLIVGSRFVP